MFRSIFSLFPALLLGGLFCFIFVGIGNAGYRSEDNIRVMAISEFALNSAAKTVGMLVIVLGLLKLIRQMVKPVPEYDFVVVGMCVLGGAVLAAPNWGVALGFAALALARTAERSFGNRAASGSTMPDSGAASP